MPNLRRVGEAAEDRAADFLLGLGYTVITRRYSTRQGEIDLIALDEETLVFVEVKERRAQGYVPEGSIGATKMARLRRAARQFMAETSETRAFRFDVIAIDSKGLRHYKDAFEFHKGEF